MINNNTVISISTGTIIRALALILGLVLAYILVDIILILLMSVVIASSVEPGTLWFKKYKIPRVLAVLTIYLMGFLILIGFLYLLVPPLFFEVSDLSRSLPEQISSLKLLDEDFNSFLSFGGFGQGLALQDWLQSLEETIIDFSSGVFNTTSTLFGGALSALMILVLSFYLSVQERGIENFLRLILPLSYENYVIGLWQRSQYKIGQWMKGQFVLALIVGVLVFLGLTILQVPYAFILAIVAAFFELIPVFGPILAAIPAVALAFGDSMTLGIAVIILYVIIQQFENHLIYPLVVKKIVGLSPILVILSLLIGAKLAGFIGIILAVPVATVLMEILNDYEKLKLSARVSK